MGISLIHSCASLILDRGLLSFFQEKKEAVPLELRNAGAGSKAPITRDKARPSRGLSLSVVGKERTPHTLACSTTALPAPRGEALATGSTALSSVLERREEE